MLLPVDHAIKLLLEQATPTDKIIRIPVANASGKILAEDILSTINVPPADNSAMDGYTLRLADAKTSQPIPISQRIPAGATPAALKPGTAARIFTGAQIPEGAEIVIMQENAEVVDDRVIFTTTPESAGANIRCAGEDIKAGEKILHRGTRLRPQELGLLASIGMDQVSVFKPVRVAVLSTGSELVEPGNPLQAGQIYNSNRPMILSLLQSLGFEAIDAGICTDNLAGTKAALEEAANNADIVMTSGGVSVGEEDHVKAAVEALGELNLWKVAIKPGKPFAFGHIGKQDRSGSAHFIGLPGNPASVFTTLLILARPFLLACQGTSNSQAAPVQVSPIQTTPIKVPAAFSRKAVKRQEYLRVRIRDGQLEPFPHQGSGVLTSACWGEGFAIQKIDEEITPGIALDYLPFSALLTP